MSLDTTENRTEETIAPLEAVRFYEVFERKGSSLCHNQEVSKPIHFSKHALEQMRLRGASQAEVIEAIETAPAQPAKYGKFQVRKRFKYDQPSPVNQKIYAYKVIQVIFADEATARTVVTVLVFYDN